MRKRFLGASLACAAVLPCSAEGVERFFADCPARGADAAPVVERIRDRIRKLPLGERAKGVVVDLGPGVWRFSRQVRFEESDSGVRGAPIVWRGAADGSTVLTASREIPLASFGPVTDEKVLRRIDPSVRDRIRVADVSGLDISEPVLHRELGLMPLEIPDVFCDGTWLPMACWPNADIDGFFRDEAWAKIPRILERGAFGDAAKGDDLAGKGGLFAYAGDRPSRWVDAPTVFLQGFWSHDWWRSSLNAREGA